MNTTNTTPRAAGKATHTPDLILLMGGFSGQTTSTFLVGFQFHGYVSPEGAMAIIRNRVAAAPEQEKALRLLVSWDDRQGLCNSIRERTGNDQDAMTPEESILLDGISAARAAIAKAEGREP